MHLSSKQESLKRKAWKTPADKYAHKGVDCKKWQFEALAGQYTLIKKGNKIFLIYKEIQMGAVAKSYMRKRFLIYEEMSKYSAIYEEAVLHILCTINSLLGGLHPILSEFLMYGKFYFIFYQCTG